MDLGCAPRVVPVLINDYQNGLAAGRDLDGIDGLFCINDYMACGVIDALRTKPRDPKNRIRLIGHDDIGQAAWQAYGLTTFRQPCDIQASQAIDLLISRMADPELEERTVLTPVTLVRRVTA